MSLPLRLILTRHAKSDWDNPLHSDHERPLNKRGRKAAPQMGRWLVENGHVPDAALVSDAVRTRETWALLSSAFPREVPATFLAALYHASPDVMLAALRRAQGQTIILIGHNPGIAAFAHQLLRDHPAHEGFARYPTCATLVADFEIADWSALTPHSGAARAFVVPRDLPE